jgi:hypothetical protein
VNELQAGVELALAVLPESSAFLQPGEGTFDHPSLRDDGKSVQIIAFGDLHSGADGTLDGFGKGLADIAAIGQDTLRARETTRTILAPPIRESSSTPSGP